MTTAEPKIKRHPIRGAIFGLLLGIGSAALLIMYAVIALGTLTPFVVIGLGVVVGVLWGLYGPAKGKRQLPPSRLRSMPEATVAPGGSPTTRAAEAEGVKDAAADAESAVGEAADEGSPASQGDDGEGSITATEDDDPEGVAT